MFHDRLLEIFNQTELLALPQTYPLCLFYVFLLTRTVFQLHLQSPNPILTLRSCVDDMKPFPMAQLEAMLQVVNFHSPRPAPVRLSSVHFDQSFGHMYLFFPILNTLWGRLPHLPHLCKPDGTTGTCAHGRCSYSLLKCARWTLKCAKAHCDWSRQPNGQEHALRRTLLKKGFSSKDVQEDLFSCEASWEMRIFMLLLGHKTNTYIYHPVICQQLLTAVL